MQAPIGWVGGKSRLRREILRRIPEHVTYVEVFGGAAWVLFGKDPTSSRSEILNDRHGALTNFFRCVRENPLELIEKLKYRLLSHEDFAREKERVAGRHSYERRNPASEIERAARFFWVVKNSFGGKTSANGSFGYHLRDLPRFRPERIWEIITAAHERLQRVTIFNEDFEDLITRLDREQTFFYCDPPYYGAERAYEVEFKRADHERLARTLRGIKGKFLLSYGDHAAIRELYRWATVEEVHTSYSIARSATARGRAVAELLIRNYEL